jgi:hypothetical protein
MVKSAIDRAEQAQLVELFTEIESAAPQATRFAESVTFWRYQLTIGVEPSQLPELLVVLDEVTDLPPGDGDLWARARKWRSRLEPRAKPVEPWRTPLDPGR